MEKIVNFNIEDLIGNLFITLKKAGYDTDEITFELLEEYRKILKIHFEKNDFTPSFFLSRDDTNRFLQENKDMYYLENDTIYLINDASLEDLINKYHGYLPLDILKIIIDEHTINDTIEMYASKSKKYSRVILSPVFASKEQEKLFAKYAQKHMMDKKGLDGLEKYESLFEQEKPKSLIRKK